jgi:hypothetical protein
MTLNIEDKTYTIPERLTIDQWTECTQWDFEDESHWPRLISILTGAPLDKLTLAPIEALELGIRLIGEIANQRTQAGMIDVRALKFGQFVDLEVHLGHGVDHKLGAIIDILAPEVEYVDEALYIVQTYIDWRNSLYRQYSNLFGLNEEDEDDIDDEEHPIKDPHAVARSWYRVMVQLSNENILNLDPVAEEGVVKTLNFMAYKKQQAIEENAKALNQKRQHDLQTNRR